jgi:hypothetical protein
MIYTVYITPRVNKWLETHEVEATSADEAIDKVLDSIPYDCIFVECDNIAEHL